MRWPLAMALFLGLSGCGRDEKKDYTVGALTESLKNNDPDVRYTAAKNLGKYGAEAKSAVPALIETLKDRDKNVRMATAYALAEIGADAQSAVPALQAALKDKEKNVREAAAYALKHIQGKPHSGR